MNRKVFYTLLLTVLLSISAFGATLSMKQMQIVDEFGDPVTNITSITVIDAGTSSNSTIYADRAGNDQIYVPLGTGSNNTTFSQSRGFFYFWSRDADYKLTIGDGTRSLTKDNLTGSDTRFAWYANYIGSLSSYNIGDSDGLNFGTSSNVTASWDGSTALTWVPTADGTEFRIGTSGTGANFDFNVFTGAAVGLKISESGSTFIVDGLTISLNVSSDYATNINTGTSTGAVSIGNSLSGAWAIDGGATGTLNADTSIGITTTDGSGDITIDAVAGSVIIDGGQSASDAITIQSAGGLIFTALDDIAMTLTSGSGGEDMLFTQTGSNDSSIIFTVAGTGADAFSIQLDGTGGDFVLDTDDGSIHIVADGSAEGDILIDAEDTLTLVSTDAHAQGIYIHANGGSAETIQIHSDQGTGATAIYLKADEGGITILADDSTTGDILIDAEDDINITAAGAIVITVVDQFRITDDDIVAFGTGNDVTFNYDENGLDNLQIKGPVQFDTTYCEFRSNPVGSLITGAAGGAVGGATGDENAMICDGVNFEYHILGAGQTIKAPFITSVGLNIRLDELTTEGMEMGEGITARSKSAFVARTDACYLKVQLRIEAVAEMGIVAIGFRLAEAYNSDLYAYNDYSGLNVNNGTVNTIEGLNGGSYVEATAGESWTDGQIFTLEVRIDSSGNATHYISSEGATNRSTSAVGTPAAFQWDSADVMIPFIHLLGDNTAGCEIELLYYECGLL